MVLVDLGMQEAEEVKPVHPVRIDRQDLLVDLPRLVGAAGAVMVERRRQKVIGHESGSRSAQSGHFLGPRGPQPSGTPLSPG